MITFNEGYEKKTYTERINQAYQAQIKNLLVWRQVNKCINQVNEREFS